jgi:hypothetical protein
MSVCGGHVFIDLGSVWIYARGEHVASLGDRLSFGRTGKQMEAWAEYCGANIAAMPGKKAA